MDKVRTWGWFDEYCFNRDISDIHVVSILEDYISRLGKTQDFFEYFLDAAEED